MKTAQNQSKCNIYLCLRHIEKKIKGSHVQFMQAFRRFTYNLNIEAVAVKRAISLQGNYPTSPGFSQFLLREMYKLKMIEWGASVHFQVSVETSTPCSDGFPSKSSPSPRRLQRLSRKSVCVSKLLAL